MGKIAIIPSDFITFTKRINFKKLVLFFDQILFENNSIDVLYNAKNQFSKSILDVLESNFNEIKYLSDMKLVSLIQSEKALTIEQMKSDSKTKIPDDVFFKHHKNLAFYNLAILQNQARIVAAELQELGVPAYAVFMDDIKTSEEPIAKKSEVLNFVFSKIPEPDENESWEKIIDFRNDPDTLKKYYQLISWVNDVSATEATSNDIFEKFTFLYYEYLQQYKIHKMKFSLSKMEIITTTFFAILARQFDVAKATMSLLNIEKQQMTMLEEESKLRGKEIAYIFKAKETFIKKP